MKLLDAHPFRYVSERPLLGRFAKGGHPVLDRIQADRDFVDLYEPALGHGLPELVAGGTPSAAGLPDAERKAYEGCERMALFAARRFFAGGKHVVTGTPDLLADLAGTDLDKVRLDDVRMPFRNFYVAIGVGHGWRLPGSDAIIDGLYVDVMPEGRRHVGILVTTRPSADAGEPGRRIRSPRQATPVMPLSLEFGDTIPEMVEEGIETSLSMLAEDSPQVDGIQEAKGTLANVINLAFNLVAYMTAEPEDVGDAWPDDALLPRAAGKANVGAAVTNALLAKGFVTIRLAGRAVSRHRKDHPRASLTESVERRGHWRRQPHGKGLSLTKIIWIKPTWVRPDLPASERNLLHLQQARPDAA